MNRHVVPFSGGHGARRLQPRRPRRVRRSAWLGLKAVWPLSIPLNQSAVLANQGCPGFVQPVEINKRGAGCVEQSFLRLECLSLTVRAANLQACRLIPSRSKRFCEAFSSCFQCASKVFHKCVRRPYRLPKVISKKVGNRCGDSKQTRRFAPPFWE
jgi:hypothetical protein